MHNLSILVYIISTQGAIQLLHSNKTSLFWTPPSHLAPTCSQRRDDPLFTLAFLKNKLPAPRRFEFETEKKQKFINAIRHKTSNYN